ETTTDRGAIRGTGALALTRLSSVLFDPSVDDTSTVGEDGGAGRLVFCAEGVADPGLTTKGAGCFGVGVGLPAADMGNSCTAIVSGVLSCVGVLCVGAIVTLVSGAGVGAVAGAVSSGTLACGAGVDSVVGGGRATLGLGATGRLVASAGGA